MSRLPVFLKLDGHSGALVSARSPGEASPAFHPAVAAAYTSFSWQEPPLQPHPAPPYKDSLP